MCGKVAVYTTVYCYHGAFRDSIHGAIEAQRAFIQEGLWILCFSTIAGKLCWCLAINYWKKIPVVLVSYTTQRRVQPTAAARVPRPWMTSGLGGTRSWTENVFCIFESRWEQPDTIFVACRLLYLLLLTNGGCTGHWITWRWSVLLRWHLEQHYTLTSAEPNETTGWRWK